jgi:hypothetical protein
MTVGAPVQLAKKFAVFMYPKVYYLAQKNLITITILSYSTTAHTKHCTSFGPY